MKTQKLVTRDGVEVEASTPAEVNRWKYGHGAKPVEETKAAAAKKDDK